MSKPRRRILVYAGLACVGLGSAGAVLPVLPTTPFLLLAAWCFARSDPELGRRLLSKRIFRPYRPYLDGSRPIPARARWVTIAIVWTVVGASAWALSSTWLTVVLLAAALIGSVFVLRWRREIK
ncbi:MAG: YbaN family protein [Planctomycetota bacterium]